jgi:hypothetical protein
VHVVIVDKPFEESLARLVRRVVGDYLPGQGAVIVDGAAGVE